jgi:hypothetical protein
MPKKPAKPDPMRFTARKADDPGSARLFAQSQLHRFVKVIAAGDHAVEISPHPGCRLSFSVEMDGEARRVRIIASEIKPAAKPG